MNKKNKIISGFIILSLLFSGCYIFWKPYKNKEHKFSINFPRFWEIEENVQKIVVVARAKADSKDDQFRENVNVSIADLPQGAKLEDIYEASREFIMKKLPGTKYDIKEDDTFLGRQAAKLLIFSNRIDQYNIRIMSVSAIKNKRVYVVTCTAQVSQYPKYEKTFQNIVDSLRFK